jgi:alkyl hydroperoxide reductase subunit AhpC
MNQEFERRDAQLIGLSVGTVEQHNRWIEDINTIFLCRVTFPIVADPIRMVSRIYDMIDEQEGRGSNLPIRSVFFIDPKRIIRAIISYPYTTGRSIQEILRVLDALKLHDQHGVYTPCNWMVTLNSIELILARR